MQRRMSPAIATVAANSTASRVPCQERDQSEQATYWRTRVDIAAEQQNKSYRATAKGQTVTTALHKR